MQARLVNRNTPGYNGSEMDPNQPNPPAPTKNYNNPLEVMSPGEQVICEITRHPIGLFGLYFGAGAVILILGVGAAMLPTYATSVSDQIKNLAYIIALFGAVFALIFTYIAHVIYTGNRWIVTSDSITQISQTGLFTKHTSQLSLANLEDVTFEQNGPVQSMVGFGLLKVETAGERSKFSFPFCPNPAQCARQIIKAHEDFIRTHPEEGQTVLPGSIPQPAGAPQAAYQQPQQPQQPEQPQPPAPQVPPYQQPAAPEPPVYQSPMPQQPYPPQPMPPAAPPDEPYPPQQQ